VSDHLHQTCLERLVQKERKGNILRSGNECKWLVEEGHISKYQINGTMFVSHKCLPWSQMTNARETKKTIEIS
jgi:hypothetical protein